ncbi:MULTISPECIES: phage major tail tube protein [unclassified Rhizobium]|uniref:phage major tail tube protein n=1 Tax=unclassified Rhizobium TaxID=2613769 RepID=UPI001ADBA6DB|nr:MULTISPECIES: phage major tail tube protein [unclassified Rhizobium]MBO9125450.1 phage major tail tube protein [Rhizobium sp. 16-488-2b]MBO9176035.1 phage major tail tube protein [Rhizobium sp. 16-488-2a]
MAQLPLYLLSAVDVRRVSAPDTVRGITIASLTLPGITFATGEHNPGGGVMAVNFSLPRIEAPEPAFSAKGIDTNIFTGLGETDRWVFAGSYLRRGPGGGAAVPGRAIIEGVINAWEPDESDPAEFQGCTHTFAEVTHYEFHLDGVELFYIDFWERVLRVGGVDRFASHRSALGA